MTGVLKHLENLNASAFGSDSVFVRLFAYSACTSKQNFQRFQNSDFVQKKMYATLGFFLLSVGSIHGEYTILRSECTPFEPSDV